jgi:peptide/nickel transport system permease protein
MVAGETLSAPVLVETEARRRRSLGRWIMRYPALSIFGTVFVLLVLLAFTADLLVTQNPTQTHPQQRNLLLSPSGTHWLGTDDLGRDTYSRVIKGGQVSLRVAVISVGIGLAIGVPLGLLAGYVGGWLDWLISRFVDAQLSFPGILLALIIVAVLGPGLKNAMIAVGVLAVPRCFRLTRGQVLQARGLEYVRAAEVIGATRWRIMFRHILVNIANPLIIFVSLAAGEAILAEAALSYLGLGAQPPTPDWGAMIRHGTDYLDNDAWMAIGPGIAIVLTVFSYFMLGDALRDYLDPRLKTN